ncbi:MAG: HNH endonuclease signature motif containing protein, partial [Acidimicrobiales bacterium]
DKAQQLSFQQFVYFVEHWSNIADPDRGKTTADKAVRDRHAYCSQVGDRIHLDALGDVISGTVLKEALAAIEQELFEADWAEAKQRLDDPSPADLARTPKQRRYDALIEMANRSMTASPDGKRPEPLVNIVCDIDTFNQACLELLGHQPDYKLSGVCEMIDGTPITPQQALEQALMGHVARVVFDADDQIINAGRSRRLYTKRMKTILAVRDRHCTWPGCDLPPPKCEVDHITEWQHGGPTNIANSRLRCRYHHRLSGSRELRSSRSSPRGSPDPHPYPPD